MRPIIQEHEYKVNRKYGLKPFQSDLDIYVGDYNLLSDVPELFHRLMPLPKNYDFCGPLFNEQDITECQSLIHYKDTGKVKIFVTMGSSGEKEILLRILNILTEVEADVFVSCTSILNEDDRTGFSSNFYFEKAYPHKKIAELVDFSIIHGGQGTVYTTLVAGKPYIGIPMFSEQQYNLENLQSYESGILLYESELSRESLLNCVHKILNKKEYRMNAKKLSNVVTGYYSDDDKRAGKVAFEKIRDFFNET